MLTGPTAEQDPVKTSPPTLSPRLSPTLSPSPSSSALALDGTADLGDSAISGSRTPSPPRSPALSTASTADGADEIESSPVLPPLRAPRLPERALRLLRTPPPSTGDESQFGTASWGSPYPRTDHNLRRRSFSSEPSDGSPVHQLDIETPFLRPAPELLRSHTEPHTSLSAAAAVLANRVRRQTRGLTEDWIRTHTTSDLNSESRLWFSDGSGSEHSSLSGSETGWQSEHDLKTPRAIQTSNSTSSRPAFRHTPRARSSIETLKPPDSPTLKTGQSASMATTPTAPPMHDAVSDRSQAAPTQEAPVAHKRTKSVRKKSRDHDLPSTPSKGSQKPLPRAPTMTPRLKKKVPWKGKNIMVLIPRDEDRGLPGNAPLPLRQQEVDRMYSSWQELGYNVSGFDLEVEGYKPPGTDDSQSRDEWPNFDQVEQERFDRSFKVTLPDLNAWKNYVNELQEAKLRALGVSFGDDEPDLPSPATTNPSRQASAQYPPLPFSPPLPTSSASSNHALPGFPFPSKFVPGRSVSATHSQSGASPVSFNGANTKYNPRQSVSLPMGSSPFGLQQHSPSGWPGPNRQNSPSLMSLNGMISSPQSPYGPESPSYNLHQRHQSLQYPMLPHQQFAQLQPARASPRLQEVREDEEELASKSPSKTPQPTEQQNPDGLQAEIDDAEYHLEEQLRNQLEHEDYNPQSQSEAPPPVLEPFAPSTDRQVSGNFPVPERFANDPPKPLVLHHPRPHSRGHSLSQGYFRDPNEVQESTDAGSGKLGKLNEIPETQKADESFEVETNPSNLGTPVQSFEFPTSFGHQKNFSTVSNPWNDAVSVASSDVRRASHGSKASLSKLNVKAPEFKFNPGSSFAPSQFSFSSNNFQPNTAFQANTTAFQPNTTAFHPNAPTLQAGSSKPATSVGSISHVTPAKINVNAPSFSPGQSAFSFSSSGPKFNPDAPAFTPLSDSVNSPPPSGTDSVANRGRIFGSLDFKATEILEQLKKSKAVSNSRPTSSSSARSHKLMDNEVDEHEDMDGRLMMDESRIKRARSHAPDGDDVPLFAEQPTNLKAYHEAKEPVKEDLSAAEGRSPEGDNGLAGDTSLSSILTSDHMDTKATTVASSQTSPADQSVNRWGQFEFDSKLDVQNFNEARPFGEDNFKHHHKKTLSATAAPFMPGAAIFRGADESEEEGEIIESSAHPSPVPSPIQSPHASGQDISRVSSPSPPPKSVSKGLGISRAPKPKGLAASRYARDPSPEVQAVPDESVEDSVIESVEREFEPETIAQHGIESLDEVEHEVEVDAKPIMRSTAGPVVGAGEREPTFEEIDAIMQHLENDPTTGVNKYPEVPDWQHASPTRDMAISAVVNSSPYRLDPPSEQYARDEASLTPREYHALPILPEASQPMLSTELEDPFIDPPEVLQTPNLDALEDDDSLPASDWEAAFPEDEYDKLDSRAQFFDGRVNDVVGNLLASRLEPLEKSMLSIQHALTSRARRTPSSRRDMRSVSAEQQESDADDEDDEPIQRSMSPRRDRRMEQMRVAVMEALAAQQRAQPEPVIVAANSSPAVMEALEGIRQHLGNNERLGEDLRTIVEDAVERRMPPPSKPDEELSTKMVGLQAKVQELEQRLAHEQNKVEKEVADRRAADDLSAELNRKLSAAETRVEVEIINRSVFDQRVADLEEKLRHQEDFSEQEVRARRAAEDRLSEVQRLLRISSEEEDRLREATEEKEQRIRTFEQSSGKAAMRMALLEAAQNNATQSQSEMTNKINTLEADLRNVRQDNHHWRAEANRCDELARGKAGELSRVEEENKHMQKSLTTMLTQLEENERLRETWRGKFMSLQDDMARAAREIAEEAARRIKKDQTTFARHEVLDARLQAEAKTRERLEIEMERLQMNERTGIRAANECKRLEGLIGEMKAENHKLEQAAMRYQREFEEARESGVSEVKRTRNAMQIELDAANNQVNVIREELEEQNSKLRAELDNVRLEADTNKAQNEMLLEEAEATKAVAIEELQSKHQNEIEDIETRYERQVSNAKEDAQREQGNLLERLNLSTNKTKDLQERILHLEERLKIAKEAAAAAAQAAKSATAELGPLSSSVLVQATSASRGVNLPEKISPQALRESIMVLQEQLQAREQRIEELEHTVAKADPDAAIKITKRDDEISWLRELLAVRHENLQDIITALSSDMYNREAVKDASIRLKANLQMEEQERERAVNGGSAINLPNIAQTIQNATPRVAQAVGPLAAAWGNWRKGNQSLGGSLSGVLGSPAARSTGTPSRSNGAPSKSNGAPLSSSSSPHDSSFLGGLLTPPASSLRQTPPMDNRPQPTAFASTGRRYPSQGSVSSISRGPSNTSTSHRSELPASSTPPQRRPIAEPRTPPMMHRNSYDSDAQPGDFDDNDFFED
ncbi:hypothetical protein G7046_g5574 [Stylonectria norvegica]|nr:hypothetical protein G7046_g5574 [Stylonectria norvegica]